MNTVDIAQKVYWDLSALYSSEHTDTTQEQDESIELLRRAIVAGTTPEQFMIRMRQLNKVTSDKGNYKTKLSAQIKNRYWDKTYVEGIPFRPFKP